MVRQAIQQTQICLSMSVKYAAIVFSLAQVKTPAGDLARNIVSCFAVHMAVLLNDRKFICDQRWRTRRRFVIGMFWEAYRCASETSYRKRHISGSRSVLRSQ